MFDNTPERSEENRPPRGMKLNKKQRRLARRQEAANLGQQPESPREAAQAAVVAAIGGNDPKALKEAVGKLVATIPTPPPRPIGQLPAVAEPPQIRPGRPVRKPDEDGCVEPLAENPPPQVPVPRHIMPEVRPLSVACPENCSQADFRAIVEKVVCLLQEGRITPKKLLQHLQKLQRSRMAALKSAALWPVRAGGRVCAYGLRGVARLLQAAAQRVDA